jgi:flagellar biosynthesis protein FlhB
MSLCYTTGAAVYEPQGQGMAEESDLERTEPASQRRLDEAREQGQVARSPELSTFAVLLAAGGGLMLTGPGLLDGLVRVMRTGLTLDREASFDTGQMTERLYHAAVGALLGLSPVLLVVAVVAIVAPMLLSGWLFTFQPVRPDFGRLNPASGLSRILSWLGLVEFGKAICKTLIIGGVAAWVVWTQRAEMMGLISEPVEPGLRHLAHLLGFGFLAISGALVLVVLVDVPFQIWDHARQLRMTKDEVRQEVRESEGNPEVKARIRSLQREATRSRMMSEVPNADVIVTDTDRYAVALKYREGVTRSPQVSAKGALLVADRIVDLARDTHVPILRAAPLARALFVHVNIGQEIPAALFDAVAEALAWAYQSRRFESAGGERPREPTRPHVPKEFDPGAQAARDDL